MICLRYVLLIAIIVLASEVNACARMAAAKKKKCLFGETLITLPDQTLVTANSLKIGDEVLAFSSEIGVHVSRVKELRNNEPKAKREFVELTVVSGKKVAVTVEHGILVRECGSNNQWALVSAGEVSNGMCVPTFGFNRTMEEPISSIKMFKGVGIVQPITSSGTILSDGIAISCFDEQGQNIKSINIPYYAGFVALALSVLYFTLL